MSGMMPSALTSAQGDDVPSPLLSKSAQGATFLILLQIGSRGLTFIVNQVLLRYLSPELLGISSQLDLFVITVIYFARDSLRVALQRHGSLANPQNGGLKSSAAEEKEEKGKEDKKTENKAARVVNAYGPARHAQEAVNLSYIAVLLGPFLASAFMALYLREASSTVLATPCIMTSVCLYTTAAIFELLIEPCFAVASQHMLYGIRASAETSATFTKCILTCATAIWASRANKDIGVLPFAIGQLSFAIVLNIIYWRNVPSQSVVHGFSFLPRPLASNNSHNVLSRFPRPVLTLTGNIYAQAGLKHILTQGDSFLIALFTSLSSQGVYTLASNYGSLLARMLFQPIEESSRGVFGNLLSSPSSPSDPISTTTTTTTTHSPQPLSKSPPRSGPLSAHTYLFTILRLYALLTLLLLSVAPTLAPLLLRSIAGPRWTSTSAGTVLRTYCYYIPLLAVNGILEAFVSAAATPGQLRAQSAWMLAFSAGFVAAAYLLLRIGDLGAPGLVAANAVNMTMRIAWSWRFIRRVLGAEGVTVAVSQAWPSPGAVAGAVAAAAYLHRLERTFDGSLWDLVLTVGVGGFYGVVM